MNTRIRVLTLGALVLLGLPCMSYASPIDLGPITFFFNPVADTPSPVYGGMGTNSIFWGDPSDFGIGSSTLSFTPNGQLVPGSDDLYVLGLLEFFNGTVELGTGIDGITLAVVVNPVPSVPVAQPVFFIPMALTTTPNLPDDPAGSADQVYISSALGPLQSGSLEVLGNTLNVYEGAYGAANLIVRFAHGSPYNMTVVGFSDPSGGGFVTHIVPEPSSALLLAGGASLAALRRRRRR